MLGLSALSWVLLIPAVLVWPVVFVVGYLIWRSSKRHTEADEAPATLSSSRPRSKPDSEE